MPEKTSVAQARQAESIGREVLLQGWVRTRRDSKAGFSFIELNDGSTLAGLQKLSKALDLAGKTVVGVVTGTGLKDTETAIKGAKPFLELPADLAAVERALGWG